MRQSDRSFPCRALIVVSLAALSLGAAGPAGAGLLRPLEGAGNFLSTVDVIERAEADGSWSLILLLSVANRELTFRPRGSQLSGEVAVTAELDGRDGEGGRLETTVKLSSHDTVEAGSPTVYQVMPVVLKGVRARSGELTVVIEDHLHERPGLLSRVKHGRWARSEAVGSWISPEVARAEDGLTLGAPVFLAKAPIKLWRDQGVAAVAAERSVLTEYLHPNRRYGLEQGHLQIYFEAEGPVRDGEAAARDGLRLQVTAKDLGYALRDTIRFDDTQVRRLAEGRATGVFYDLDLKDLPPGAYQLGCAPANGRGRAFVAEFDVIWSASLLNRRPDELLGEGRTVLYGDPLDEFESAGQAERESILERFWQAHDPDPATPVNEAYQEYRRRVAYVREYLGGFNRTGAVDPRGAIYLILGPPDELSRQVLPLNETDQTEALQQVFDNYRPDREGTQLKASGVPLELSHQSRQEILSRQQGVQLERGFELWRYNHAGNQLFPNRYSGQQLGLRFLFVDRNGSGAWALETTNAVNVGSMDSR